MRRDAAWLAEHNAKRARACAIADGYSPHVVTIDPHSKYKNRPTGGYASVKESRRAAELKMLEQAGKIRNLQEQVPFILIPTQFDAHGHRVERPCKYFADFVYEEAGPLWVQVVEDTKGIETPEFKIKKKLMLMVHGIAIKVT
jgi:Protein of unknown function (DUF1064)